MEKNKYEDVIENQIKESSKIIALCVDQNHEGKGICKVDGIKNSEMVKEFKDSRREKMNQHYYNPFECFR